MSRLLRFVSKSETRISRRDNECRFETEILRRNNEPKKEEFKKNIQTKEADFGFTEVFFHNIPNEQVSDKMAKVIPK